MSQVKAKGTTGINGAIAAGGSSATVNSQGTGLLPNFLSFSGSTRQNDLDVSWTMSFQPAGDKGQALVGGTDTNNSLNTRQSFLTFGDKSWGSIKLGKDLGIFASDAILSDMTLLGVGSGAGLGNATNGRIGTGYIYADWKSQIAYTTPNFNGFQATVGLTQGWNQQGTGSLTTTTRAGGNPAYEGKASYSFSANDVTGKVWVSGIGQKQGNGVDATSDDSVAYAGDIGANVNLAGFGLTGYYYSGQGIGTTAQFLHGYSAAGKSRDSDGGYVQATYVLPTKTKVGVSWGQSNLDLASNETTATNIVKSNEMWTAGLYHPLTKHLNIVAEYSNIQSENHASGKATTNSGSLGAILFF
ncbi:hypothetical protein MCETWHM1_01177 [Candidatus Methylopumilus planktonicus]|uniref:porin n=1 Tax=Candidatus Methylopumilus planktonicus TaxID=1581557 RepID=UPI003BEEBEC1